VTDAGTARRDPDQVDRAAERLAAELTRIGVPRMPARVYATILLSPHGALTAAEITERLSVSPAAVSKAVRYLSQLHLVHRGYQPESRRDLYQLGKGLFAEMLEYRARMMRSLADALGEAIEAVGGDHSEAGTRLAELRDFSLFAQSEAIAVLDRWHARRGEDWLPFPEGGTLASPGAPGQPGSSPPDSTSAGRPQAGEGTRDGRGPAPQR
jgi:DNA-binding transcriptional regulator GbsR (MarR family)